MQEVTPHTLPGTDRPWPPTQDELPSSDGMPMETHRHVLQSTLLTEPLRLHWAQRSDVFVGSNMFVYFSPDQVLTEDFRGPDVFVVQGVPRRDRKSWVVWEEGGRGPDVVIELLSESTAQFDKTEKKRIYQVRLRVPEYFWYDPYTAELAGFSLRDGAYEPIAADAVGRLPSRQLGLLLVLWQGEYGGEEATWLRSAMLDGTLLPTGAELAAAAAQRADAERERAEVERARAERAEQRLAELEARLARLQERPGAPPDGRE